VARVKMEEIVDHLSSEIRSALAQSIRDEIPNVNFDEHGLFRAFRRHVGRRCSTWERVPDRYVDV
jgi:hypothetical protein